MELLIRPLLLLAFALSLGAGASAQAQDTQEQEPQNRLLNFGAVYGTQWAFYGISQHETIRTHGSFQNWVEYPFHPEFDKDTFDYNLFKHAASGGYYYLFYRSRGYSQQESFVWTALSSLAFEFTVETVTEKPSIQDIYQTPLFGAIVGIGFERLSQTLHSLDTWYGHTLGYILNPFSLLPKNFAATPTLHKEAPGVLLTWGF